VALVALFIGLFIAALGMLGVAAPKTFLLTVSFFQVPPAIYLAAVIRTIVGVVLVGAAPASRAPKVLRVLGFVIVIGGLLTPFVGIWLGDVIIDWWSAWGNGMVRLWDGAGAALGAFIIYAVAPKRRAA
jgi:hypothetical protein